MQGGGSADTGVGVTLNDAGLHFAYFNINGALMITTIFGATDTTGRYIAVRSRHGTQLEHESSQFYGTCDIGLANLEASK